MRRNILLYGAAGGVLIAALRAIEYRFLVLEHSLEIYGGLVAALFAAVGIALGVRLARGRERVVIREVPAPVPEPDAARLAERAGETDAARDAERAREPDAARHAERARALGVTPRELEILELIAAGLSTREIAERIFVSQNTVKTHASRLFGKLGARRRTEAVRLGKQHGLIR